MAISKKASTTPVEPGVKELKQSVERLQALIDEAPIGICSLDLKGKFTYVNKRFEEVSGYSRDEVLGKNVLKLGMFPDETVKLLGNRIKSSLRGGRPPHLLETQFKCKDGHWIWVAIEGKLMKEGRIPVGFQIISRDITERKEAEDALQESEEKYRTLVEDALIGVMNVDITGKITYVNKTILEATGYSWEEMVGKNAFSLGLISSETAKILRKQLKKKLMGQPPGLLEMQYKRKNGEWIWLQIRGRVLRKNNVLVGIQIIGDDITERKQAEEALKENRERLQKMFESVTDGISVIDLNGVIAEVNQRTVKMHGFKSRDDLLGKSAFALVAPRDHDRIAANMRKAVKEGTVRGVEYTLLKADGSEFPGELSTSILKDASGKWIGHITIARDITQRKRAEEVLRESEERYRNLFESTYDMIQSIAPDGRFVFVNRAWLKTMGYTEAELKGLNLFKIIHPDSIPHCQELFAKVISGESVSDIEATFVAKDGRKILVEGNAAPRLIGGKVVATQGFFRDVTERKRMEEELKTAQEQLIRSEKLAAIGQLASGVGHELRNPLGAIKNAVLYVRRKVSNSELSAAEPKVLQFLDLVDEEVESANKVITDLLSFSRIAKPAVSLVNAGSIIRDSLNHVALPENIELVTDVDPGLPMVMVDASQIRQVFINVILNGLEAMPEGGRFEIRARSEDESVIVHFTDAGCGIPESVIGRIFDPLFTTKPRGIGLGLAMSKNIMDRHGGDMGVKSKEGKGTTFTVSLPTRVV